VVDEQVRARHIDGELDDGGAARGHQRGLDVVERLGSALWIDGVEDLADDGEAGREVWPADAEEDAHLLAYSSRQRTITGQRCARAIEDHVLGFFVQHLVHGKTLRARLAGFRNRIEVPLHDVVFAVDRGKALWRLDEDKAVHALGNMHWDD